MQQFITAFKIALFCLEAIHGKGLRYFIMNQVFLRAPHPEIMERFPPENFTVPAPLTFLIRRHFSEVSQ